MLPALRFGRVDVTRPSPLHLRPVTRCSVDADGVPAEWIETTAATVDQMTLVVFAGDGHAPMEFDATRRLAGNLAVATGARVLLIGCRAGSESLDDVVRDGLDGYAWLLGEGVDLETTALIAPPSRRPGRSDPDRSQRAVSSTARSLHTTHLVRR